MAAPIITWDDKEDADISPELRKYKVVADDMNELKNTVNALAAYIDLIKSTTRIVITSADFSGENYDNAMLVGLTADVDFTVQTNSGSGVILKVDDGYSFDDALGRLSMSAEDYVITIYKPVS